MLFPLVAATPDGGYSPDYSADEFEQTAAYPGKDHSFSTFRYCHFRAFGSCREQTSAHCHNYNQQQQQTRSSSSHHNTKGPASRTRGTKPRSPIHIRTWGIYLDYREGVFIRLTFTRQKSARNYTTTTVDLVRYSHDVLRRSSSPVRLLDGAPRG